MKQLRKNAIRFLAVCASASFLTAAPVAASTQTKTAGSAVKTGTIISTKDTGGYVLGLESRMGAETEIENQTAVKSGLVETGDASVYYDAFGQKVSGLVEHENEIYYFDEQGEQATGFQNVDGKTYYFSPENGQKVYGEVEEDGRRYILDEDGSIMQGLIEKDGQTLYLQEDGSVLCGQAVTVEGVRYLFDDNGFMETNVTRDGWIYDETGAGREDLSGYDKIAQAALAQIGVYQDCTRLVSNSLAAVGINFHGAPYKYLSLGPLTNNPVPGDICVYQGHVAIYVGNGQAVHGGWNGNTTVLTSVQCSQPFIGYVHPILP